MDRKTHRQITVGKVDDNSKMQGHTGKVTGSHFVKKFTAFVADSERPSLFS
jgi:hypothetical protein